MGGNPESPFGCENFQAGFSIRRRMAAAADGRKEFISTEAVAHRERSFEIWGKTLNVGEATGSKSSGPAAFGPSWGPAGFT
jgi:hypothetical protein